MKFWRHIQRLLNCFRRKENTPLVIIIGPTGVGKTKLSIELAKFFGGEVISADSMQLYKNLDILTNKATLDEQQGIPHHLIDFVDPLHPITVVDYRNRALPIIEQLLESKTLPVIVGGTMYYIESLLYKILIEPDSRGDKFIWDEDDETLARLIDDTSLDENITKETLFARPIIPRALKNVPVEILYSILTEIDPATSSQIQTNDRRKIIRSLQVYQNTGRLHSDWLKEQRTSCGGCKYGGPLRYPQSIIFYLTCDETVLEKRLFERVDKMIEVGLINELLEFHENYNKLRMEEKQSADYTEGIFQSIGFKEFHSYLMLSPEERESKKGVKMLQWSINRLKLVTSRYARRQRKWIRKRLLEADDRQVPDIFQLDTTNLDKWESEVADKAIQIVDNFVRGKDWPSDCQPVKKRQLN